MYDRHAIEVRDSWAARREGTCLPPSLPVPSANTQPETWFAFDDSKEEMFLECLVVGQMSDAHFLGMGCPPEDHIGGYYD